MFGTSASAEWNDFLSDIAAYMSRLLAILKHTTLQLSILTSESGEKLRKLMDEVEELSITSDANYAVMCRLPVNFVYHCTRLSSSKRHLLSGMKAIRHYCGVVL